MSNKPNQTRDRLGYLKLRFTAEHFQQLAAETTLKGWNHRDYLERIHGRRKCAG